MSQPIGRQITIFVAVVLGFGLMMGNGIDRLRHPSREPTRTWIDDVRLADPTFAEHCGPGNESPELTIVLSPEKGEWIEHAVEAFVHECHNSRIRLVELPDLEALDQIETGKVSPDLWLPSDAMFADAFAEQWALQPGRAALEPGPSLLRTPVVLLMWNDAAKELARVWEQGPAMPRFTAELLCPTVGDDQLEGWAGFDIRHVAPSRRTMGMLTLIAMTYGHLAPAGIDSNDQTDLIEQDQFEHELEQRSDELEAWLRACKADHDEFPGDGRLLVQHLVQQGPSGFDGVLAYEHLAFEALRAEPELTIIYPRFVPIANHPTLLFPTDEIAIARRFVNLLASDAMQIQALMQGLRPAVLDTALLDVPIPAKQNPFLQSLRFGALLDLDDAIDEPPRLRRDALRELTQTWSRATGRY